MEDMTKSAAPQPFAALPNETPDAALSASIRAHLAYRRATQADLAAVLGISQVQVSARMRGEVRWTVAELYAVAEFLEVKPVALLKDAA